MNKLEKIEPGMYTLYELIDLLPPGFTPVFAPRLNKLYFFLVTNKRMGRKKAAEKYLGNTKKVKYFDKLRLELTIVLNRHLIANPSWASSPYQVLYEDCYRRFAMYRILLLSSKRISGIRMAEKLLPDLQKVELYAFSLIVANDLLLHYSSFDAIPSLAKKYSEIIQTQLKLVNIEAKVRKHYSNAIMLCNSRTSYNKKIITKLIEATEETWPLLQPELHHINRLIYSIRIFRYTVDYDYKRRCCMNRIER